MAVHLADEMAKVKRIVVGQWRGPAEDKFCFLPRRCFLTGKSLFMKKAVRTTRCLESFRSSRNNQIKQHFWGRLRSISAELAAVQAMLHNKEKRLERIDKVGGFTVDNSAARCILFRRCYISNRLIFLRKAVKMRKFITGPGFPLILVCWIDKKELLLLEISGKLDKKSRNPFD